MLMPALDTARLQIRPFILDDLDAAYHLLDVALGEGGSEAALVARRRWLAWSVLGYEALASLHQPPYGDRAIVLRQTGQLVGACGLVPCLMPFGQLPTWATPAGPAPDGLYSAEVGLFYALSPAHQRRGYATEVAQALVGYAFRVLRLRRIVATTTQDNGPSLGVMRKLGMRIEENPYPEPPWFRVVGVLENEAG